MPFSELATKVALLADAIGFGTKNATYIRMSAPDASAAADAPTVTPARYSQMTRRTDTRFTNYHANRVREDRIILGEGPYQAPAYNNLDRFIENVLLNDDANIQQIIALGAPFDIDKQRQSFSPYFTERQRLMVSNGTLIATQLPSPIYGIGEYSLTATQTTPAAAQRDKTKTIRVTHFEQMADMQTLNLASPQLIARVLQLYLRTQEANTFIHCSAGLGRSGVFAMAFALIDEHATIMSVASDDAKAERVIGIWNELSEARPGVVQNKAQLENALELADAVIALKAQLEHDEQTAENYLQALIAAAAALRQSGAGSCDYDDEGSHPSVTELQDDDEDSCPDAAERQDDTAAAVCWSSPSFWEAPTGRQVLQHSCGDESSAVEHDEHHRLASSSG